MKYIFSFIKKLWFILALVILYFALAGLEILPKEFNILKFKKLEIDNTPVVVQKIKEIGELTTAEFYGEVYADLNEVYEDLINSHKDSVLANPSIFYKEYSGLEIYIKHFGAHNVKEKEYLAERQNYKVMLDKHIVDLEKFNKSFRYLSKQLAQAKDANKKTQIRKKMTALTNEFNKKKTVLANASKKFELVENQYKQRKKAYWESRKQRNLVYIGRGWVKAGINLKRIAKGNIMVDANNKSNIKVILPELEILNADINPWFIYTKEKKVKGFEVFMEKTGSIFSKKNFTDKEVRELKHKCKEKLIEASIKKGILKNAKSSTLQTLDNFFHLLGFKQVTLSFENDSTNFTTNLQQDTISNKIEIKNK